MPLGLCRLPNGNSLKTNTLATDKLLMNSNIKVNGNTFRGNKSTIFLFLFPFSETEATDKGLAIC